MVVRSCAEVSYVSSKDVRGRLARGSIEVEAEGATEEGGFVPVPGANEVEPALGEGERERLRGTDGVRSSEIIWFLHDLH
jgi:hypothetical protein